jgi:AraC-like DNA-binding protein
MSDHVDKKRLVRRYITDSDDVKLIIDRCALKSVDKQILAMILIDRHDEGFVADTLGYSYSQVKRRFAAALDTFVSVAQKHRRL